MRTAAAATWAFQLINTTANWQLPQLFELPEFQWNLLYLPKTPLCSLCLPLCSWWLNPKAFIGARFKP